MKKLKSHSTFVITIIIAIVSLFTLAFKYLSDSGPQWAYGDSIKTKDMHEIRIAGKYDPNEYRSFLNSWHKSYDLTVSSSRGWHFIGEPKMHCVQDNQGAFGWNDFSKPDHFYVTERNANFIKAHVWIGSREITVNLACMEEKDKKSK
jgi:hypothetical protein